MIRSTTLKKLTRITAAAVALCVVGFAAVATVSAHVNYVSSSPSAGEQLTSSPATVHIVFDAEIQATAGSFGIDVTDASGASVVTGNASRGADKKSTSIALKPNLPDGAYHVAWHQTSADDGDAEEGEFSFSVGAAAPMPASPSPEAMPHTHDHMDMPASSMGNAAPPTVGMVTAHVAAQHGSGIEGRIEVSPVESGAKTQVAVYLTGTAEGASHAAHIHVASTCFEGPHAADLKNIAATGSGGAQSVTIVDLPFSLVADGNHNVLVHAGATQNSAAAAQVAACGIIPAQPAASASGGLPTTGLIVIAMGPQHDSAVSGRAEIFPADGGTRTRIDLYLSNMKPGTSHMAMVHNNLSCSEAPGAHAASLNNVVADDEGRGMSSTTINVSFSTLADGRRTILSHAGANPQGDKTTIACGKIPAQPAALTLPTNLPQTGAGVSTSPGQVPFGLLATLALAGTMIACAGVGAAAKRNG